VLKTTGPANLGQNSILRLERLDCAKALTIYMSGVSAAYGLAKPSMLGTMMRDLNKVVEITPYEICFMLGIKVVILAFWTESQAIDPDRVLRTLHHQTL